MKNLLLVGLLAICCLVPAHAMAQTIPNNVTVAFVVCMEGTPNSGNLCITGNNDTLSNWGEGIQLVNVEGDLWTAAVIFPAGTPVEVRYKYRRNDCQDWESDPDRSVMLPTDGTPGLAAGVDSFNRVSPIGCGLSSALLDDVTVCFQLCLSGITTTGSQCVIGNIDALGEWGTGLPLTQIGTNLYQHCVTFPAGTFVPLDLQYKFQKDDCTSWENVDANPFLNRELRIDADAPPVLTVTSTWGNEPGTCDAVTLDDESWGTLKSRYDE